VWRFPRPALCLASGPLGGGPGERAWVVNATVQGDYARLDPDVHLGEIAETLGLAGEGVGMLTAVDVGEAVTAEDGGVQVVATVGLGYPTWAAAPDGEIATVGTINIAAWLPVALSPAALVNAVSTITEAKVQALWAHGVEATGTASDALCVACVPYGRSEQFGGPRSVWGARLARAVHAAVLEGTGTWLHRYGDGRPGRPSSDSLGTTPGSPPFCDGPV
jgi:adenosylcobinamide amidohydrolase